MRGADRIDILPAWAVLAILWLVLAGPALADDPRRVALVVGNADYEHTVKLRNPVNDATGMASALERLGFRIILGEDVDREKFFAKIEEFTDATPRADVALFFYAGHGLQVDGRNYLVPVDAELEKKLHLKSRAIDLGTVLDEMRSPTNLVFLDACRDNPLAESLARSMDGDRSVGGDRGLARVEKSRGTLIAFATEADKVAKDGEGKNSPFTAALLEHIGSTPELNILSLLNRVSLSVIDSTGGEQQPWISHSALPDEFPLRPKPPEFKVVEVARVVMWASEPSNARSGPGDEYATVGSLRAGDEVTVTGEVEGMPWVRVEMVGRKVAYVPAEQLIGDPWPPPDPRVPGVYLTADVSAGEPILSDHLEVIGRERILSGEIRDHTRVAGGCYTGAKVAGKRLSWSDVSAICSQ